jgi:hypothetical protein
VKAIAAPGVHGVLAVPELRRVFASATGRHELLTIDARTEKVLGRAPAGVYPDGIAYDPEARRIFVSDEAGGILAVFDSHGRRSGTIRLGGAAGNVQYDAGSGRILVDVQTRNEVALIDPHTDAVVRRLGLPGCNHDHGLLVDAPRRLAFVACDRNARLLTLDLRAMKVIGTAAVGQGPDVLALDSSLKRLYVAAESGDVAVFGETGRRLTKLGQAQLAPEAHTVAVDSRTHLVYFPLQGSSGRPELRIMAPGAGAKAAPGFPPTGGDSVPLAPGLAAFSAPWRRLATGASPAPGGEARARGGLLFPNALAFTVSAAPTANVQLFWSVYCESSENDVVFVQQGSVPAQAPVTGQPTIPAGENKCVLTIRVLPRDGSRAAVQIFAY